MRCKDCSAEIIRIHTMGGPAVCWASPVTYWPVRDNEARGVPLYWLLGGRAEAHDNKDYGSVTSIQVQKGWLSDDLYLVGKFRLAALKDLEYISILLCCVGQTEISPLSIAWREPAPQKIWLMEADYEG